MDGPDNAVPERDQASPKAATPPRIDEPNPELVNKTVDVLLPILHDPRRAREAAIRVVAVAEEYSGPIPHPNHLRQIAEIVPGGADRLLTMAEEEQEHRHRLTMLETGYQYLGLAFGFLGFVGCLSGAAYLSMHDQPVVGGLMLGVPVVGVVGWFIRARPGKAEPRPNDEPRPAQQRKAKQRRARG